MAHRGLSRSKQKPVSFSADSEVPLLEARSVGRQCRLIPIRVAVRHVVEFFASMSAKKALDR